MVWISIGNSVCLSSWLLIYKMGSTRINYPSVGRESRIKEVFSPVPSTQALNTCYPSLSAIVFAFPFTSPWKRGRGLAGIIKSLRFAPKRCWMRGGRFVRIESWLSCSILLTSYLAGSGIACMYFKWYH